MRISAPLVTATVNGRVVYLYRGDVVPTDIGDESLENLRSLGYVVEEEEDESDDEPPRAGRGSGAEAWRTYAESLGLTVDGDETRDEIIARVNDLKG